MCFVIREPIPALKTDEDGDPRRIVTIPAAAVIRIVGTVRQNGLINAVYRGASVFLFPCDLKHRADCIIDATA